MSIEKSTLHSFPWSTYGRRESAGDFWKKVGEQKNRVSLLSSKPLVSVVIWLGENDTPHELEQSLDSLHFQSYPNWEAIVVGRAERFSDAKALRLVDSRVKWHRLTYGLNSAQWKQEGASFAEGEWLAFLRAGDVLSPAALYDFMVAGQQQAVEFLHCNSVELSHSGTPTFISRSEYSWFTLIHLNYIGSFWLVRRPLFDAVGGFLDSSYPHEDHVFLLKLSELTERWKLLPVFHYYSKQTERRGGTEWVPALREHLARKKFAAEVKESEAQVSVEPLISDSANKLVSVVICFKDNVDWTLKALKCLGLQLGKVRVEVILVNNNSKAEELLKLQEQLSCFPFSIKRLDYEGPFNFGHMHNVAIRKHVHGDFIMLLNNDVFWSGANNMDRLIAWAQFDWVGTIGFLLRYQHGGVQHSGFSASFGGEARLVRLGNANGVDRFSSASHEVFGNTFAACLFKKSTFDNLGGFRELDVANGFGDVSFNFECLKKGLHNLYLGQIEGVHLESASRGLSYEYWEECLIEREYPEILQRMLRLDLGVNRIPQEDYRIFHLLGESLKAKLRKSAPWLKPVKDSIRKLRFQWMATRTETA